MLSNYIISDVTGIARTCIMYQDIKCSKFAIQFDYFSKKLINNT